MLSGTALSSPMIARVDALVRRGRDGVLARASPHVPRRTTPCQKNLPRHVEETSLAGIHQRSQWQQRSSRRRGRSSRPRDSSRDASLGLVPPRPRPSSRTRRPRPASSRAFTALDMRGSGPVDRAARALLARARSAPATTAPRGARRALGDRPSVPSPRGVAATPRRRRSPPPPRASTARSSPRRRRRRRPRLPPRVRRVRDPGPRGVLHAAAIAADDHGAATTTASPGGAPPRSPRFAAVPSDQGTGRDVTLDVFTVSGARTGETVTLPGRVFDVPLRVDVAHRVVIWQRNKRRAGTHHAKTRARSRARRGRLGRRRAAGGRAWAI